MLVLIFRNLFRNVSTILILWLVVFEYETWNYHETPLLSLHSFPARRHPLRETYLRGRLSIKGELLIDLLRTRGKFYCYRKTPFGGIRYKGFILIQRGIFFFCQYLHRKIPTLHTCCVLLLPTLPNMGLLPLAPSPSVLFSNILMSSMVSCLFYGLSTFLRLPNHCLAHWLLSNSGLPLIVWTGQYRIHTV